MKREIKYDVVNKPSKDKLGRTNILERVYQSSTTYEDTVLGYLTKTYGGDYQAVATRTDANGVVTEAQVGNFATRSKGGHAIRNALLKPVTAAPVITINDEIVAPTTDDDNSPVAATG